MPPVMPRPPRKPTKELPTAAAKVRRGNILLENLSGDFRVFGENLRGLCSEFGSFKLALEDVDTRLQSVEPIIQTLRHVPEKLEEIEKRLGDIENRLSGVEKDLGEIKPDVKEIKGHLETSDQRLSALELKASP